VAAQNSNFARNSPEMPIFIFEVEVLYSCKKILRPEENFPRGKNLGAGQLRSVPIDVIGWRKTN